MSVDLPLNGPPDGMTLPPGPVTDIVILFGGWGSVHGGDPLTPGTGSSTARLANDVRLIPKNLFRERKLLFLEGAILNSGVDQALRFIRSNFHPRGRLIIYGYSAGGTDALALARRIQGEIGFYSYTTGRLHDVFSMEDRMSRELFGAVRVDLLITVDGASGPMTGALDRTVPTCVRLNRNFYQRTASRIGSHGGPNTPVDPTWTVVRNVDCTGPGVTHGNIGDRTNRQVLEAIQFTLGAEGDFPPPPSDALPA